LRKILFELKSVFENQQEGGKRKNSVNPKRTKQIRPHHKKYFKTIDFKVPKPIKAKKEANSYSKMHLTNS